jgi:tRNA G18 (ribose-2'-O)-methylase SpoU
MARRGSSTRPSRTEQDSIGLSGPIGRLALFSWYRRCSDRQGGLCGILRVAPPAAAVTTARLGDTGQVSSLVPVEDARDPRLADYVRLTDVSLRRSLEAEHGLFVAEGEKVIRRAVEAGYPVRSLLVTGDRLAAVGDLAESCPGPVYLVSPEVAERLTGYRVHRGALAALRRRPLPPVGDVVAGARRIVVLEDIVDHTNVGAIFRCVAALGFDAVVLAPRCADPLYRRSVRVSMGAVFAVPYARMDDWRDGLAALRAAGFRLLALTLAPDAVPIGELLGSRGQERGPDGRLALLLGTEGDGLSSRWRGQADLSVRIPMRRGVDSLNVAAAAAVACYLLADAAG